MRSSLYCSSAALAESGSALPSRPARWTNIWTWNAAPLAQCLKDLQEQTGSGQNKWLTSTVLQPLDYVIPHFTVVSVPNPLYLRKIDCTDLCILLWCTVFESIFSISTQLNYTAMQPLCHFLLHCYSLVPCTVFSHLELQSPPSRQVFSWVRVRLSWPSSLKESWTSLSLSFRLILTRFRYSSINSWSSQILCWRSKYIHRHVF